MTPSTRAPLGSYGVILGLMLPLQSWAASSNDSAFFNLPFSNPNEAISELKLAYEAVSSDPYVASLLNDGNTHFALAQKTTTSDLTTSKFQAYYKGVEILGAMSLHQKGAFGSSVLNNLSRFDLDVTPSLSANAAVALAQSVTGHRRVSQAPELKILPSSDETSAELVYWINLEGQDEEPGKLVVLNAHTGRIIARVKEAQTIAPIHVYAASSKCQTVGRGGAPISLNTGACDHVVRSGVVTPAADASAKKAASNSQQVLDYYLNRFGWNSFDNKGSPSVSVVHVGNRFNNAYWSPSRKIMAYGDGDGVQLGDFTRAVDVAGHEMTHGVVSSTAQLAPFGEAGALNESYSDIFGKLIANDGSWVLGKEIFIDSAKAEGIRNLEKPGAIMADYIDENGKTKQKPYPAHMKEIFVATSECSDVNDDCWVHVNSTIFSHGAYQVIKAVGQEKAERIYFDTLVHSLTPWTSFRTAAKNTMATCQKLYDRTTCSQVRKALGKVGFTRLSKDD